MRDLATSGRLHRRGARNAVADTADDVSTAQLALDELTHRAQPLLDQRTQLRDERDRLQQHLSNDRDLVHSFSGSDRQLLATKNRLGALDTWADWANGSTPRPAALINAARHLHRSGGDLALLAEPLSTWMQEHNLAPQRSARTGAAGRTARSPPRTTRTRDRLLIG